MEKIKTFVAKIDTPWGDAYPQAVIGVFNVRTVSESSNIADGINGDVVVSEGVAVGGTYQAEYFNSATTQAQGKPERPVVFMENGVLTSVFTIDFDDPQVKQILAGTLSSKDKRDNIARVQLIKHFQ